MEELINFVIKWAAENNYSIVVPNDKDDEDLDFITINSKTNTIYFGDLNVESPLTDVG